ncbi:MAG: hypothetical protein DCC52_16885 [Chloroflexi bacterium]|nr:MAG: hypothetical protein DCC52_16885 [Chloroflexota bacterium]
MAAARIDAGLGRARAAGELRYGAFGRPGHVGNAFAHGAPRHNLERRPRRSARVSRAAARRATVSRAPNLSIFPTACIILAMVPTRASDENELTPVPRTTVVTNPAPAAESASQALALTRVWRRDARWLGGVALVYAALVVITVLTLNAYFAQTWDAVTFVGAGKIAGSSGWAALYAQSRADNYWPYAYPPLHAFLVAPFVALAGSAPAWLLVRVPPLLFDLALGVLLYGIVWQKTRRIALARLALAVWLLNPVTWYDTAVQGHFESEWLFFVVLGYFLYSVKRGWILPTLILAVGFLLKQNVILFALPFWALLFFEREKSLTRRGMNVAASAFVFAIPIALVSLPFLLYSNDYWFMNVQYVSEAPLQTQSWLVGLAGLFGAENFLLRASSGLTLAAAGVIAFFGARHESMGDGIADCLGIFSLVEKSGWLLLRNELAVRAGDAAAVTTRARDDVACDCDRVYFCCALFRVVG